MNAPPPGPPNWVIFLFVVLSVLLFLSLADVAVEMLTTWH